MGSIKQWFIAFADDQARSCRCGDDREIEISIGSGNEWSAIGVDRANRPESGVDVSRAIGFGFVFGCFSCFDYDFGCGGDDRTAANGCVGAFFI